MQIPEGMDIYALAEVHPNEVDSSIHEDLARGVSSVNSTARFMGHVTLGRYVKIGGSVIIGEGTEVGAGAIIDRRTVVGGEVVIGERVRIGTGSLILDRAIVCAAKVESGSSDARKLEKRVSIGPDVKLHDEIELGEGAVVPTQQTVMHIGYFGRKNRVVTIYGSDDGPRYSIGCQIGVNFDRIASNVRTSRHTHKTSSQTYLPYLSIFNDVGYKLQKAYDREAGLVAEIKDMRTELCLD